MRSKTRPENAKPDRREVGDRGFSLIELIVVVAILGVLVAIAIPVFGNIQSTARLNAVKAVAANGATQAAAQLSQPATVATLIASGDAKIIVGWGKISGTFGTAPTSINTVCVWASYTGDTNAVAKSGLGCV
ncbi:MAG: type II secretion system protein [Propionicimonas sp.]